MGLSALMSLLSRLDKSLVVSRLFRLGGRLKDTLGMCSARLVVLGDDFKISMPLLIMPLRELNPGNHCVVRGVIPFGGVVWSGFRVCTPILRLVFSRS